MIQTLQVHKRLKILLIQSASLIDERGAVDLIMLSRALDRLQSALAEGQVVVGFDDLDCLFNRIHNSRAPAGVHFTAYVTLRQTRLLGKWFACMDASGLLGGQILLDRGIFEDAQRASRLRSLLGQLLTAGAIPVIGYASPSQVFGDHAVKRSGLGTELVSLLRPTHLSSLQHAG